MIRVAAGILEDARGNVLLQRRVADPCAGQWEFPGGKIEPGEEPHEALARELAEEIGARATKIASWVRRTHRYAHGTCDLRFMRVLKWAGTPRSGERQEIAWVPKSGAEPDGLLEANRLVWKWLRLPKVCAISAAGADPHFFADWCRRAQDSGLRMILLRDKKIRSEVRRSALRTLVGTRRADTLAIYSGPICQAAELGADGVHLSSKRLRTARRRPKIRWVGASCHDGEDLALACALPADYALLSPVRPTRSHPKARPLGWDEFSEIAANSSIPVFGLGGLTQADLGVALAHGAHGIASMREHWVHWAPQLGD